MATVVTDHLNRLIAKQVDEHKLVVWYDPERAYEFVATRLELPGTSVVYYDGSFFALRHEIDHLLNGELPPRLVVYVPLAHDATDSALVELEAMGVVMRPAQQPPSRNTKLSIVARNALKPIVGEETAAEIERHTESEKLTLADLNTLGEKGRDISSGLLSLVFGSANPQEVALDFAASDAYDAEIEKKSASKDLVNLFQTAFDFDAPAAGGLVQIRAGLTRHVLLTELASHLIDRVPRSVSSATVAETPVGRDACVRLARAWRNNRELRDSYVEAAGRVEREFLLDTAKFDPKALVDLDTFMSVDRALVKNVEESLLASATSDLLEFAQSRQSRFWASVVASVQARWALVATAAQVLLEADRVAGALKRPPETLTTMVQAYAEGNEPWCLLDTYHRHLEGRWFNFEPAPGDDLTTLERLVVRSEQRYTEVGSEMAQRFVTRYAETAQPIKGLLRQLEVFESEVAPRLASGKLAYVWVDALRYEMARELARLLKADFEVSLQPAMGTPPSITEIGMAALLPGADESAKVVSAGGGKLALEIAGVTVKDRKDRVAFLAEHAGAPVFDLKLEDLLRKPLPKKIKSSVESAGLVLVTSQEIDELCERDNIAQARLQMDGVLSQLRRGVRVLGDLGINSIVIAADHGHLFADEISEDMKIESPGGKVEDLHRRVWVGIGGASNSAYLRAPLSSLGVDSDLDMATPWNFACFKSKGGARAYFHGGLSPEEIIIPVLVLTPLAASARPSAGLDWVLKPGSAALTTRFFSVQVGGQQTSLFTAEPPKVRIEVRAGKKCISRPVSASYGFEDATGEIALRPSEQDPKRVEPNTIALMIVEEIDQKAVDIYLLDAGTGAELARLNGIDAKISI